MGPDPQRRFQDCHYVGQKGAEGGRGRGGRKGQGQRDVRPAEEDLSKAIAFGNLLHLGARVGDGNETTAGFLPANEPFGFETQIKGDKPFFDPSTLTT